MPAFLPLDTRTQLWVFLPSCVPRRGQLSAALGQYQARSPTEPDSIEVHPPSLGARWLEDRARSQVDVLKLNLDRLFSLHVVLFQQLNRAALQLRA